MFKKLVQVGVTGLTPKLIKFFLKGIECFIAFTYHRSQAFPVIFEILQWNVVSNSLFLLFSDFRIQQSIFKIFDITLALDAAEKVCILQNSIEGSRTTVGKEGDFLTMEQTKCKNLSKDQLKKTSGKWSKNSHFQLWVTLEKLSRDNSVYDYDNLMRQPESLLGKQQYKWSKKTASLNFESRWKLYREITRYITVTTERGNQKAC